MIRKVSIKSGATANEKVLELGDTCSRRSISILDHYERQYGANFDEKSFSNAQRLAKKLTKVFAFVYTNDPISIYKGTHKTKGAYYDFHTRPRLRRGRDCFDEWREKWRPVMNVFLAYILARYAGLLILQLLIHLTTDHSQANHSQDGRQNVFKQIGDLFGHPLSDFTGIVLILYAGGFVAMSLTLGLSPYRYSIKPADAVLLRCTLFPLQELCRIDLMLEQRLKRLMFTIKRIKAYKPILHDQQEITELVLNNNWSGHWNDHINERVLGVQHQAVKLLKGQVWLMRPNIYSPQHWMDHYAQLTWLAIVIAIFCLPLLLFIPPTLVMSVVNSRCQLRGASSNCSYRDVLSWRDMYAFGELCAGSTLSGLIIVSLFLAMILYIDTQLSVINCIHEDLLRCLSLISRANWHKSVHGFISMEEEFSVDFELTRTLVKLTTSLIDIKKIANFVSELMQDFMSIISVSFSAAILAGRLSGLDMQIFRGTLLTWIWIGVNVLLIWCAYVFAKSTNNERIGWSILAQIDIRSFTRRDKFDSDVIGIEWQRLVQSYSISDGKNSIRLFGMSLTFEKVLQFNFLVVSTAALLLSR